MNDQPKVEYVLKRLPELLGRLEDIPMKYGARIEARYQRATLAFPTRIESYVDFKLATAEFWFALAWGHEPFANLPECRSMLLDESMQSAFRSLPSEWSNSYNAFSDVRLGKNGGVRRYLGVLYANYREMQIQALQMWRIYEFLGEYEKLEIEEKAFVSDAYWDQVKAYFEEESLYHKYRDLRALDFERLLRGYPALVSNLPGRTTWKPELATEETDV